MDFLCTFKEWENYSILSSLLLYFKGMYEWTKLQNVKKDYFAFPKRQPKHTFFQKTLKLKKSLSFFSNHSVYNMNWNNVVKLQFKLCEESLTPQFFLTRPRCMQFIAPSLRFIISLFEVKHINRTLMSWWLCLYLR